MFITLMAPLASLGLAAPGWGRVARLLLRPGPDGPGDARYLASPTLGEGVFVGIGRGCGGPCSFLGVSILSGVKGPASCLEAVSYKRAYLLQVEKSRE